MTAESPRTGRIYDEAFDSIRPHAVRGFDSIYNAIRTITIPLTNAHDLKEFNIQGTALYAIEASDRAAEIRVRFNEQVGEGIPFREGRFIAGTAFSKIYVTSDAQAGKSITLLYAVEDRDLRVVNPGETSDEVNVSKATVIETTADVTVDSGANPNLIAAQNSDRRELLLTNLSTTVTYRVGDTNVAAARGIPLQPGQTITLSTTAPVYAHAPSGTDGMAVMEVED